MTDPLRTDRHVAALLRAPAKSATSLAEKVQVLTQLQRTYGNAFMQRVIQAQLTSPGKIKRNTPAGTASTMEPVKQQWEADWNDPALRSARRYFRGKGRPKGTPKQRYDVLCPLYRAHGISRPLKYITDNITTAKFFQFETPAHKDLKGALKQAESTLEGKYTEAPVKSAWAFNARTTSTGEWSNHADGKAIDLDPDINPHLTSKRDRKIITLLTGFDIEKPHPGAGKGLDSFDAAKEASDRFRARYNPAGLRSRIEDFESQALNLQNEMVVLQAELEDIPKGRKASREERRKAKDLRKRIKNKKAEVGRVEKNRKLLEKELQAYEKLDQTIDTLGGQVSTLQQEIIVLEALLAGTTGTERSRIKRDFAKKKRLLKKTAERLEKKEKARKEHKLRRYAATGFLNLPKDLVEAMRAAGFRWGGDWKVHKDFMHFDLP
jgi:hypothetical protein